MSAVHLPPAEPPADDVAELQHLLALARAHLTDARQRLARAEQLAGYSAPAGMVTRVMQRTRAYEVSCWTAEVAHLEDVARSLGIQP